MIANINKYLFPTHIHKIHAYVQTVKMLSELS